jgi:hypothetical protein
LVEAYVKSEKCPDPKFWIAVQDEDEHPQKKFHPEKKKANRQIKSNPKTNTNRII